MPAALISSVTMIKIKRTISKIVLIPNWHSYNKLRFNNIWGEVPIPLYIWSISGKVINSIKAWPLLVEMIGDPSKYRDFNGISFRRELLLKSRSLHGEYN